MGWDLFKKEPSTNNPAYDDLGTNEIASGLRCACLKLNNNNKL